LGEYHYDGIPYPAAAAAYKVLTLTSPSMTASVQKGGQDDHQQLHCSADQLPAETTTAATAAMHHTTGLIVGSSSGS
jgi:hypothetical protein